MVSRPIIDPPRGPAMKSKKVKTSQRRERSADDLLIEIENAIGESWLARIYRERILNLRTRSYVFVVAAKQRAKESTPEIQHTLLGIELKVGHKRMLCPVLATARYFAIFARTGCDAVPIPFAITNISQLATEFETSSH